MAPSIECPKCGHAAPEGSSDCENCGITFEIFSTEQKNARREKEAADKAAAAAVEEAKYTIQCLKCGHTNSPITDDCIKCGVIFEKCYESTEQELLDDPDKADELAELLQLKNRHAELKIKLLDKQKEEAARKEQEEKEHLETLRKERKKQEALKEEQEALKKEQAEKERLEAEKRAAEEKEHQEELRKKQAEKDRIESEKRSAEEKKRQEELEKEQAKLKKEQEEQERVAALKELEAEKKRQAEAEHLEAKKREQDEKDQREAIRLEKLNQLLKPKATIKKLLKPYIGESVGMNYEVPTVVKSVKLLNVNEDYISVHAENDETVYSYPIRNILSIAENIDGITTGGAKNKATFPMIIRVSHRMV